MPVDKIHDTIIDDSFEIEDEIFEDEIEDEREYDILFGHWDDIDMFVV